ncbi:thioesterase II family protein [Nocardia wallacei]|uniref:thioesterase II family protein n=1 Tax=Nocardia wallacei TaxID=480035 RepID=UPI00245422FD|nr:alpha/beta fold hydrolase [Nocardia wallacei]
MTTTFTDPGIASAALNRPRAQRDARMRLVCFPHSGAGPELFSAWADGLAPDIEVWTVTLPGRGRRWREPFAREWVPLVTALSDSISQQVPRPLALFGHSLGALLAYETAHRLAAHEPPEHLFVSARASPERTRRIPIPEDDGELLALVDHLYAGVPGQVRDSPELARHFAPALRADLELGARYPHRPGRTLPIPITALGGLDDATVGTDDLAAWRAYTSDTFTWRQFPGNHFYPRQSEAAVLRAIRRGLARRPTGRIR